MSLRYALLALLTAKPMTGYDLAKAFNVSVGHVWHAPDSQIYPELRRMLALKLVEAEDVPWGPRSTKTQYAISDTGLSDFRRWMEADVEYSRERDPAHLKAAYLEWVDPSVAVAHLERHIAHYTALREQWAGQLASIVARTHPIMRERLTNASDAEADRIVAFKAFTYEGLVARADLEIEWARAGLRRVAELNSGTVSDS